MRYDVPMTADAMEFLTLETAMRPPRVAILFSGDADWRRWARLAVATASRVWAGGGHILVPYDADGGIAPLVLDAVAAFDPDHVLLYAPTLAEIETIAPGSVPIQSPDGEPMDGQSREDLVRASGDFAPEPSAAGQSARRLVAERCTPFQSPHLGEDGERFEALTRISSRNSGKLITAEQFLPTTPTRVLAPDPLWASDAALWASATHGLPPARWSGPAARPEPPASELWKWNLGAQPWLARRPPAELLIGGQSHEVPDGDVPTWFALLDSTVGVMAQGYARGRAAIVIGDTASDFALAAIYRVLFGSAHWVPNEVRLDPSFKAYLEGALGTVERDLERDAGVLAVVSTSIAPQEVGERYAAMKRSSPAGTFNGEPRTLTQITVGAPALESGLLGRYITEGVGAQVAVPVRRDAGGSATTLTSFSPPTPTQSCLVANAVYWLVDLQSRPQLFPSGRGLPPEALLASGTEWAPAVRASRFGLTLNAESNGLVVTGTVMSGRLARPMLRFPGLRDWADAMAGREGDSARHSPAGEHAQFVASRLGSRQSLIELVNSSFLHALRLFDRRVSEARCRRREHIDGIVDLDGDRAYLSASAIGLAAGAKLVPDVRDMLDRMTSAGLTRRGLILKCAGCRRGSFHSIDTVSQSFRCPRCDASNELSANAWFTDTTEPEWYYDLHSALRELINQDGDIPILAAQKLQGGAQRRRTYSDCPELEIVRNGESVAEFDLLAHVDDEVIVVEAKRVGTLGKTVAIRNGTARKLALAARLVKADAICLATAASRWNETDLERVRSALQAGCPHAVDVRTLELLAPPDAPPISNPEAT